MVSDIAISVNVSAREYAVPSCLVQVERTQHESLQSSLATRQSRILKVGHMNCPIHLSNGGLI
jgi:hypothetical protein